MTPTAHNNVMLTEIHTHVLKINPDLQMNNQCCLFASGWVLNINHDFRSQALLSTDNAYRVESNAEHFWMHTVWLTRSLGFVHTASSSFDCPC